MATDEQRPASSTGKAARRAETARDDRDAEIARLRAKLDLYESFDRQVLESVTRSAELLRQAMELRDSASNALSVSREEVEQVQAAERQRQRDLLSDLLDDVIHLQGQAERLARRIADALDEVEADLPAGEFPSAAGLLHGAAAYDLPGDEDVAPGATPPAAIDSAPTDLAGVEPFALTEHPPAPEAAAAPKKDRRCVTDLLIHNVPETAVALALQRHLSALNHVSVVEPREFVNGLLRLKITSNQPLTIEEVQGLHDHGRLEPVTIRQDLIELRYLTGTESDDLQSGT